MAERIKESTIFILLIVFLVFMAVNFDFSMAMIFVAMVVGDYIIWKEDKIVSYPFERTTSNRFKSLLESLIGFAGFLVFQSIALRMLTPSIQSTTQSIRTLLSLYSTTTPALQGNILLTFLGFGIAVPFIETRFFNGRLYEGLKDFLNKRGFPVQGRLTDKFTWLLAFIIGSIFALYHLTARRCGSASTCQNALLLITFVFGTFSTLMVVHYGETKQATLVHVFANSLAISYSLGLLTFIEI